MGASRRKRQVRENVSEKSRQEQIRECVFDAFMEAAPYLQDSRWLREKLEECVERSKAAVKLVEKLEEERRAHHDRSRQMDLKIYLMYLEKTRRRRVG